MNMEIKVGIGLGDITFGSSKSNVKNIDYDSGSMDINDDGTLTWK